MYVYAYIGVRRNFRRVASPEKSPPHGKKVIKKPLHGEKGPHKEKNIAKRHQHRKNSKRALHIMNIFFLIFQGGGRPPTLATHRRPQRGREKRRRSPPPPPKLFSPARDHSDFFIRSIYM